MLERFVSAGVDVGSTWLDLGFHPFHKPIRVRNNEAGVATIVAALGERGVRWVALEAVCQIASKRDPPFAANADPRCGGRNQGRRAPTIRMRMRCRCRAVGRA
jgi:hypothetical protein